MDEIVTIMQVIALVRITLCNSSSRSQSSNDMCERTLDDLTMSYSGLINNHQLQNCVSSCNPPALSLKTQNQSKQRIHFDSCENIVQIEESQNQNNHNHCQNKNFFFVKFVEFPVKCSSAAVHSGC